MVRKKTQILRALSTGGGGKVGGFDENNLCIPVFNWEREAQDFKVRSSTVQLT